ncbi:helix-turn-helix domain-containing protein [Spirosoma arcticum]
MSFYFNAYSTPLLFGFVQAWVYAVLLWVRGRHEERLSDVLLGWVLVGLSFTIWEYMLGFGGIEILWRQLDFFPRGLGLLFAPLCYFYLRSQFNADFRFSRRDWWHALPFLIDTGYHLIVFSLGRDFVANWQKTVHDRYYIPDITFVFSVVQSLLYLYLSQKLYRDYRAWIKTQFSETDTISFRWFRNFLIALTISLILSFAMTMLDIWLNLSFWEDWWDKLAGVILIYYVSIAGYGQVQPGKRLTFQPASADPSAFPELANWKTKLVTLMDTEKPYLEPELSLADLARRMQINPVSLSQVINAGAGKNFNDFVNGYRVDEFKERVRNPANGHLSFLGIALECGFNSKATFNRAFRKCTGLSPKAYVETQKSPGSVTVGASLDS